MDLFLGEQRGRKISLMGNRKGYTPPGAAAFEGSVDDLSTEFVLGDLLDANRVERLLKDAEGVIHLGAIPGPLRADSRVIFDNNAQSALNVMMSAAKMGLRRVVFSSSAFGMGWAHDGAAFVPLYIYPWMRNIP